MAKKTSTRGGGGRTLNDMVYGRGSSSMTPAQFNRYSQQVASAGTAGGSRNAGAKKRTRKPVDPDKRKQYVDPKSLQHQSVQGIVGKRKAELEAHINDPRYKAKILAQKAADLANTGTTNGYDLGFAKGKDTAQLRKEWKNSLAKATSPGRVKSAIKDAHRKGTKLSAKQARSMVKKLHAVKFGVDPYHK